MITANNESAVAAVWAAYQPPALVVLGSIEDITLSSNQGSYCDGHGRDNKKSPSC